MVTTGPTSKVSQETESAIDKISREKVNQLLENTPRAFIENRGQLTNDDVRFYAQDGLLWFTDDGAWFEIRDENNTANVVQIYPSAGASALVIDGSGMAVIRLATV